MVRDCPITIEPVVSKPLVNVLLIEDNLAEARLLQELLKGTIHSRFSLSHAKRLTEAIAYLHETPFDIALLDLTLPDSTGLDSLDMLIREAPALPIVVLTNTNDEELAVEAVRHGAQDYLIKRQVNQEVLVRSLRYAIERKQASVALRQANEVLEERVKERTAELETANIQLRQEVEQRQRIQERLTLAQEAAQMGTFEWEIPRDRCPWPADSQFNSQINRQDGDRHSPWLWSLHPNDLQRVEQELDHAIQTGQGLNTEFRILEDDRKVRWMAIKSSLFCDETGQPHRLLGIHMDITEKKSLEEQFLRAQRLESLGTLASGIAHDLNNILTPVLLAVQIITLKLPDIDDSLRHKLEILENSARRGADLVKQILAFASGVEGKRFSLQVSHLLNEIRKLVQQTLPKTIEIETDIPKDLWSVSGDATQLHQVFMNLCVNARDAMPDGGLLQIAAENLLIDDHYAQMHLDAHTGPYVVVTLSDTGTGIPPEVMDRMFDPFFTTKEVGKGTGLGLSAVLGIVESHGGFIDVQSEVGQGSQFKIYLPATQTKAPVPENPLEILAGQGELVLVVDDEPIICEVTKTALETYNYQVLIANDGLGAIALLAEHKAKVYSIVMDLMMPSMDGLTAIPLLRRLSPNLKAIATSGLNSTEAVAKAEKLGFNGFLSKPFATRDLLQLLRQG